IFVEDGEATFRDLERREVERALAGHDGVLSLGGGSVLDPATQSLLAGHTVVYLQVGIADAAKRVGFDRSRPLLALQPRAERVLVVHPRALRATGEAVRDDLAAQGFSAFVAEVPDAEEAKSAEVASFLWGVLGQAGFTRSDAVVSVGGGAVTDLAGFVAATW